MIRAKEPLSRVFHIMWDGPSRPYQEYQLSDFLRVDRALEFNVTGV
jgi:hypothetical protein